MLQAEAIESALGPLFLLYLGLVGAAVGSFVGVVVARLPHAQSVVAPRSRCDGCGATLTWYDNIPLISFVLLLGRCRFCNQGIGLRSLLVELLGAALFAAFGAHFGPSYELVAWLPLVSALLAITFLDIDHFWVPDVITLPSAALALAASFLPGRLGPVMALWGLVPALGLWVFALGFARLAGKEGLGLGDVKLLAVVGLMLGPVGALVTLFIASVQGSVVGMAMLWFGRGHAPQTSHNVPAALADDDWQPDPHAIAFGPFICLSALEVALLPDLIGNAHLRLISALLSAWA